MWVGSRWTNPLKIRARILRKSWNSSILRVKVLSYEVNSERHHILYWCLRGNCRMETSGVSWNTAANRSNAVRRCVKGRGQQWLHIIKHCLCTCDRGIDVSPTEIRRGWFKGTTSYLTDHHPIHNVIDDFLYLQRSLNHLRTATPFHLLDHFRYGVRPS